MVRIKQTSNTRYAWALVCIVALLLTCGQFAATAQANDDPSGKAAQQATEATEQAIADASEDTKQQTQDQTADKRKEIVEEAIAALRETQNALQALDKGESNEALAAMERATGKLEVILAREPDLALAPVDVRTMVFDVIASTKVVNAMTDAAEQLLEDGRVQEARSLLTDLRSEYVISMTNLPMATYPQAIKEAVKLVDEEKIDEAKAVLQTALNTLVVTDTIIPIPVANAQFMLEEAQTLAEKKDRSEDESERLKTLLDAAEIEIERAEALGYGTRAQFETFTEQIEQIREKTAGSKSSEKGFFDKIKEAMEDMIGHSQSPGSEKPESSTEKSDQ